MIDVYKRHVRSIFWIGVWRGDVGYRIDIVGGETNKDHSSSYYLYSLLEIALGEELTLEGREVELEVGRRK